MIYFVNEADSAETFPEAYCKVFSAFSSVFFKEFPIQFPSLMQQYFYSCLLSTKYSIIR